MKKFNLGQELSKNEQKKVSGGGTVTCRYPNGHVGSSYIEPCSQGAAYCAAMGAIYLGCY